MANTGSQEPECAGSQGAESSLVQRDANAAQLREFRTSLERQQDRRKEEYEQSQTPYLSVEILAGQRRQDDRWVASCRVNADGNGVAYNVIVNLMIPSLRYTDAYVIRYLRAPGSAQAELPHRLRANFVSLSRRECES